jgi:hypothetical protein
MGNTYSISIPDDGMHLRPSCTSVDYGSQYFTQNEIKNQHGYFTIGKIKYNCCIYIDCHKSSRGRHSAECYRYKVNSTELTQQAMEEEAVRREREADAARQCNEAIELYNTANNLSGQAQIDRRNEAIDALDRAIRLNPSNKATYVRHRATMAVQRDREVIALQEENQRKVNEADGLYREGLRLKAQNTEQSLQSAVEKFRAAARITVNSEYRALYQREEAAATAAIPAVREAAAQARRDRARERDIENKQAAVRVLLENAQQKITARDIHGAKMKCKEAEAELQKGELRYQAGDLLRNQLREQRERILATERVIAEEASLRNHTQAEGYAATAERLKAEANGLEGRAKINKLMDVITSYDRAIELNTAKAGEYRNKKASIQQIVSREEGILRNHTQAEGCAATAERLKAEANRLEGQEKIDKLNEAIGILDEAIGLRTQKQAEYREIQGQIIAQRNSIEEHLEREELEKIKLRSRVDEVIRRFNIIIEQDLSEESYIDLIDITKELHELIDEQKINEPYIVNRMLVTEMRIARYELRAELKMQDSRKLKAAIINLLRNEILVLDLLEIAGGGVREELNQLLSELRNNRSSGREQRVELAGIAERVLDRETQIGRQVQERLAKETHEEKGNSLVKRQYLIGDSFESYYMDGMDHLLSFRVNQLFTEGTIKLLPSTIVNSNKVVDLFKVISLFEQILSKPYSIVVQPLLIPSVVDDKVYHWVGIVGERRGSVIQISYLDSEKESMIEGLEEGIINKLEELYPSSKTSFTRIPVEQQRYNNCGPELIENFIYYLTGTRATQEAAIYLHSLLLENTLLNPKEYRLEIEENNKLIQLLLNSSPISYTPTEHNYKSIQELGHQFILNTFNSQSQTKRKGLNSFQEGSMIDISLPVYEYTMSGITKILALRSRIQALARTGNVGILPNYYSFRKEDNNISQIFLELRQRTENHVLVPLSLYDKHAVGVMFVAQDDGSGYKAFYLDPENTTIPEDLAAIFKDNGYEIEQLPTEGQKYTNCGPEVIENFMLYLTGERLSQEEAIVNNSRLVEQELLSSSYEAEEASCLTLKDSYSKQDAVTVISNTAHNTQVSSDDYIIDNPTRYDIVTPHSIIDKVVVRADLGRKPCDVLLELVHDYRINQDYVEVILGEVTSIDIS